MSKAPVVIREKKQIKKMSEDVISIHNILHTYLKEQGRDVKSTYIQKIYLLMIFVMRNNKCHFDVMSYKHELQWKDIINILGEKNIEQYFDNDIPHLDINVFKTLYKNVLNITGHKESEEVLFYVLESFEYVHDSVEDKKKKRGIYYSPSDLVKYIVDQTIDSYLNEFKFHKKDNEEKYNILIDLHVADISCGTGIFLSYTVEKLIDIYNSIGVRPCTALNIIFENNIYGLDISESAVETTIMLLVIKYSDIINKNSNDSFVKYYFMLKNNIKQGSATSETDKNGNSVMKKCFPKIFEQGEGFKCIVGNPPYSYNCQDRNQLREYVSSTSSHSDKLYLFFVENLIYLTGNKAVSGLVIPLAISYNSSKSFKSIRNLISDDSAEWKFAFFDRSPDSIFGDDVKIRVAIVFRNSFQEKNRIMVTDLIRWNSSERDVLFNKIQYVRLTNKNLEDQIFKAGTELEVSVYNLLVSKKGKLSQSINNGGNKLYYYSSAYNWLPVFINNPLTYNKEGKLIKTSSNVIYTSENEYLIYALLCSTITFWLWIGISDVFHLQKKFFENLPYDISVFSNKEKEKLIIYGFELWEEVQKYRIENNNAGKIITNYAYVCCYPNIENINRIIMNAYGIEDSFALFLKKWYLNLISAGRDKFKYDDIIKRTMEET